VKQENRATVKSEKRAVFSDMRKATSTPATMSKQRSTLSNQHRHCCQNGNSAKRVYRKIRHLDKVECCFDIVAVFGNIVAKNGKNVEATFDFVERIVRSTCSIRQCCFDIVAGVDGA